MSKKSSEISAVKITDETKVKIIAYLKEVALLDAVAAEAELVTDPNDPTAYHSRQDLCDNIRDSSMKAQFLLRELEIEGYGEV